MVISFILLIFVSIYDFFIAYEFYIIPLCQATSVPVEEIRTRRNSFAPYYAYYYLENLPKRVNH